MRTVKNTIICDVKAKITSDEVDWELKCDVLGKKNVNDSYESDDLDDMVRIIDKGEGVDEYPIKISELRKILDDLEKEGCNYVSMYYNCDHPDYTFYGADVHVASESEISEFIEKEKNKKLKEVEVALKRYEEKTAELLKIANELKK